MERITHTFYRLNSSITKRILEIDKRRNWSSISMASEEACFSSTRRRPDLFRRSNSYCKTEAKLRVDLAAAHRWLDRMGMNQEGASCITVKVPKKSEKGAERYLLVPEGRPWSNVQPSNICLVDGDGRVLDGGDEDESGRIDHSTLKEHRKIHQTLGESGLAVIRAQTPYATAMSCIKPEHGGKLLPLHLNSLRFHDKVAYMRPGDGNQVPFTCLSDHNDDSVDANKRLDKMFEGGKKCVLVKESQGVTVVGKSMAEAFANLNFFEKACKIQMNALSSCGGDISRLNLIDGATIERIHRGWNKSKVFNDDKYFISLQNRLDAEIRDGQFAQ